MTNGGTVDEKKYRLITRSDFDGLVSAILLSELDMVESIEFVHPKDMQDGKIPVSENDISTNLPYVEGIHLAFDHHSSEVSRVGKHEKYIVKPDAPSAARVVYDYYGGAEKFGNLPGGLMEAVDKSDSAQFSKEDVQNPQGWELLSFLMDARTGLGRFRDFRISNKQLMSELIGIVRDCKSVDEVLAHQDVKERVEVYNEQRAANAAQLERCGTVHGNLVVLDLRNENTIYAGNRFVIYAMFPQCNISIHVMWGRQNQNVVFATGKSIFDRGSKTDVGELMLKHGGGGHKAAGTCQIETDRANDVLKELISAINADG